MRNISHELRTPVNGALNYLDASLKDSRIDKFVKETYIKPSLFCLKHQLSIINDFLDFFQLESNSLRISF